MSHRAARHGVATIKRRKHLSGMLPEVYIKESDAQRRLGNSACVFIKLRDRHVFFVVSDNVPEFKNYGKFFSAAVGASISELGEAKDIQNEIGGAISDLYSAQDFYPTVALYFLSRYLKGVLQEFWSPRALAVNFMIFDPLFEILHTIKFDGDYGSYALKDVEDTFVLSGGYNPRLRKELMGDIQRCLDDKDVSTERLQKLGAKFCKKYNLQTATVVELQIKKLSRSDTDATDTMPGSPSD